jgi:hypothetical protein
MWLQHITSGNLEFLSIEVPGEVLAEFDETAIAAVPKVRSEGLDATDYPLPLFAVSKVKEYAKNHPESARALKLMSMAAEKADEVGYDLFTITC